MLLVQKKRRKQDDPEETYVLVAGFVDLHDINQNVHLSVVVVVEHTGRQLCGLRIRIKTLESIWKHYQRGTPPPPLGIGVLCGKINGSPEFNSSFILLLLRRALKKCNVQAENYCHCSCSRTMKCISFSSRQPKNFTAPRCGIKSGS